MKVGVRQPPVSSNLGETEILIDGGGKSPGVVTYLNYYVDGALEVMVATHPHADHIRRANRSLRCFQSQGNLVEW